MLVLLNQFGVGVLVEIQKTVNYRRARLYFYLINSFLEFNQIPSPQIIKADALIMLLVKFNKKHVRKNCETRLLFVLYIYTLFTH